MFMKGWLRGMVLATLWMAAQPLPAAISHDSQLEWKTLRSTHFTLHFHQGHEHTARELLAMAESIHQKLSLQLDWVPQEGTEIVLSDESDSPNGWATPYPTDRMLIYLVPPDSISGLEDHAGWLEMVFTHEYLHVLHLDKAKGVPAELRSIFGRFPLLFPNALQPAWFIEGLATYAETDTARGIGRGQSSYYEMAMRMEALSGIKPLSQVNQPLVSWPMGDVPYLYGVYFYQWLVQRYGKEKLVALVDGYSDNIIPYRIGSNAYQTTGNELIDLWKEFAADMQAQYAAQQAAITARGLSVANRLTSDGYFAEQLVVGASEELYYTSFDAQHRPALMRLRGTQQERLADIAFGARLDFHVQQGLLVAQPEICHNAALYYDLYRYDNEGRGRKRLTTCGRYRNALWSADGKSIIAVHHEGGFSELHLLDGDGRLQQRLWRGDEQEVPGDITLSPDGTTLAASFWQSGQGWELAIFDIQQRVWRVVTRSKAIEGQPQFSSDGKTLYYSADYDGVYNIYALDMETAQIARLTNVVGGAFNPQRIGDHLYYVGYSAKGFDIYQLAYKPRDESVVVESGSGALSIELSLTYESGKTEDYSPWQSVRPFWWLPQFYVDKYHTLFGAITAGGDTLQRHVYAASVAHDARYHWTRGSLDYSYDRWDTMLKLHAKTLPVELHDKNGKLVKARRDSNGVVELVTPFLNYYQRWALHIGVVEEKAYDLMLTDVSVAESHLRDRLVGVALGYDSASEMPRSVSRADGRELLVVMENSDLLKGSDYSGRTLLLDWKELIRLGGEHVLAIRGVAGSGETATRPFRLGGYANTYYHPQFLETMLVYAPFNRRSFALRGYDEGLPQLTGTQMRLGSLEYRFPLKRLERGLMSPPLGLHQLSGTFFAESGAAWQTDVSFDHYYSSYGVELGADSVLFYSIPLRIVAGYAHGIDKIGSEQFYIRFGAPF